MASASRSDQVRDFAESFGVLVKYSGGLALLALPALIIVLLFGGLMAVGRGTFSRGTNRRDREWARSVLAEPRYSGDEPIRRLAQAALC